MLKENGAEKIFSQTGGYGLDADDSPQDPGKSPTCSLGFQPPLK